MTKRTDIATMTTAQIVAEYNTLTGSNVKRMSSKAVATRRLSEARKAADAKSRKAKAAKAEQTGPKAPREGTRLHTLWTALQEGNVHVKSYGLANELREGYVRAMIGYLREKGWEVQNVERNSNEFYLEVDAD